MRIILLGAPGAGKGTQAEFISEHFRIPAISTGNMIRAAVASGSALGRKIQCIIDKGLLVPDDIVIEMIRERLSLPDCKDGYLLDGFPRTLPQVEALSELGIDVDVLLSIDVDDDEILRRMTGRRICLSCGATYHVDSNPPLQPGICGKCGEGLSIRKDDALETVEKRLAVYHSQTEPIKEHYAARNKLKTVNGVGGVEEVSKSIFAILGEA